MPPLSLAVDVACAGTWYLAVAVTMGRCLRYRGHMNCDWIHSYKKAYSYCNNHSNNHHQRMNTQAKTSNVWET